MDNMTEQMAIEETIKEAEESAEANRLEALEYRKHGDINARHIEELSMKLSEQYGNVAMWLKELIQYRAIGTVEEIIAGLNNGVRTLEQSGVVIEAYMSKLEEYQSIGTVEELQVLIEKSDKGLLLELPCKVGTEVYVIIDDCNGDVFDCMHDCEHCREHFRGIETRTFSLNMFDAIGKDVFLTKEEAEQHLDWE